MDDDDSLRATYDLDAWAPPAAPDVTAAVIARMNEPVARGAAATMVEQHGPARTRRKWTLAGIGFTATAVGALITYLVMRETGPGAGQGTVATATPTRLDLGASSAQLEANTDLAWHRDGHALRVDQPRGTSTWTLGPDESIEIKAGAVAGGDHVAIRATGASLRVEVGMNMSDAKVIGASAVAASAVAAITIVVYEGEAKVTSGGQTVEMRAGGTLEARAERPPTARDLVGGAPIFDDPDLTDRKKLQAAIDKLRGELETCMNGDATSPTKAELVLDVAPSGGTEIARLDFAPKAPEAAELCVNQHVLGRNLVATRLGGRFRVSFQLTRPCDADALRREAVKAESESRRSDAADYRAAAEACRTTPRCDHDGLVVEGEKLIGLGQHAKAVDRLEAALACDPQPGTLAKAYLAACNAKDQDKAIAFYRRFTAEQQNKLAQVCVRNGIPMPELTVADVTPSQDASKDPDIQAARVALADDKWEEAIEAAERAMARHPEAKELADKAHLGARSDTARRKMEDYLKRGDYQTAATELANARKWPKVGKVAEKTFMTETAREVARLILTARSRAASDDTCATFRTHMTDIAASYPENMVDRVRHGAGTCKPKEKVSPTGPGSGSAATATVRTPKNPQCPPEKIAENKKLLEQAIQRSAYAEATAVADRVLACGDYTVLPLAFLATCNGRDATTAKRYFRSMDAGMRDRVAQICIRNGIQVDK
jgi:hypothetical protein